MIAFRAVLIQKLIDAADSGLESADDPRVVRGSGFTDDDMCAFVSNNI